MFTDLLPALLFLVFSPADSGPGYPIAFTIGRHGVGLRACTASAWTSSTCCPFASGAS